MNVEPNSQSPLTPSVALAHSVHERAVLRWVVAVFTFAAALILLPLAPWIILGVWVAALTRPFLERITKVTRGRNHAAGLLTLLLIIVALAPLFIVGLSVAEDGYQLSQTALKSPSGKHVLLALVSEAGPVRRTSRLDMVTVVRLIQAHGQQAWGVANIVIGALAQFLLGLFIFFLSTYACLVHGKQVYRWMETHTPLSPHHLGRFAAAFLETGRGLIIGTGLTGLLQALAATLAYSALGVPRPMVLGFFTFLGSFFPAIGAALIWVPVSLGLLLLGKTTEALILAGVGIAVISTVDNVLRPVLSKWGQLDMPFLLLFFSMLGGVALLGGWGLLLGPLVVRLCLEGIKILKETESLHR